MRYLVVYLASNDLYVEEFATRAEAEAWIKDDENCNYKAILVESESALKIEYHT